MGGLPPILAQSPYNFMGVFVLLPFTDPEFFSLIGLLTAKIEVVFTPQLKPGSKGMWQLLATVGICL